MSKVIPGSHVKLDIFEVFVRERCVVEMGISKVFTAWYMEICDYIVRLSCGSWRDAAPTIIPIL